MVIFTALPAGTSTDEGRIVVDESDYQGVDDEQLPFEIKDVVRIRANEKFSKYYACMDELGEGKFGKVYRCREKATGLELAAKRIKIKRDADREKVEREVAIMTQLRHPRIAQIYDAFATPDNDIVLVMEIVNGGELFDRVVDENYILTELAVVMIVCQLCEAISYIHSKNIVHLDIKVGSPETSTVRIIVSDSPENIMCVSQTGNRIKLIDFGLAQFYDGSSNLLFMAGTPEFVAPEVIKFEPIDFHTDMWSIGVITYILLSGISPFLGETLGDTYVAVEKGEWEFDDEAFEAISDAAKDFISKLLIMDQKQRMLPEECLNHPWIVGSRAKAASDLILSQPNAGTPLSKDSLKTYLRNKRFRKAAWALLFLIRFKRQILMNSVRRKIPATFVEVSDSVALSLNTTGESYAGSEANTSAAVGLATKEQRVPKVSIDIPVMVEVVSDTSKAEPAAATKHPEQNKLSSEIPKKKPKPNTSDDGRTRKKAKKHKGKSSEKSDEIPCKPKKVFKHPKASSDGLGKQEKQPNEVVSETGEEEEAKRCDPEDRISAKCEICITLEAIQPATLFTEFTTPVHAAKSKRLLLPGISRTSKNETDEGKRSTAPFTPRNPKTQELPGHSSSTANRFSDINKKGSSVAAILSFFTEKAEQERKRFERRPSRPVKTFRDVEKPSSRKKASLASDHENETIVVKLYRAPEEEKERVKNLIELHRRGSADRKQVGTQEIVAVKHDESLINIVKRRNANKSPRRTMNIVEKDCAEAKKKCSTSTKIGVEAHEGRAMHVENVEKQELFENSKESSDMLRNPKGAVLRKKINSVETRKSGELAKLERVGADNGKIYVETDASGKRTKLSKKVSEKKHIDEKKALEGDLSVKDAATETVQENPKKLIKLRSTSSSAEKKTKEHVEKGESPNSTDSPCTIIQVEQGEEITNEILKQSSALRLLSANLESCNPKVTQNTALKKPPKCPGVPGKKKSVKEKVRKLQDGYGSDGEVSNFAIQRTEKAHASLGSKLTNSVNRWGSHAIQDTTEKVHVQLRDVANRETSHEVVKRSMSQKNSIPKNSLMKIKSEINLAERAKKAQSNQPDTIRLRRKAVDDDDALTNRTDETRRTITIASLKQNENFNFGWLKLQLETRVNKEKEQHTAWRPRRELGISPVQTGNAKKALNIWKKMEQNCNARI